MKKMLLILSLITVLVGLSIPVFANDAGSYATGNLTYGSATTLSVATSKNVMLNITFSGTTNPVYNYVITSYHQTGTRTFGSSNADAKLYFAETTGVAQPTCPTDTGVAPTWTGYSPL